MEKPERTIPRGDGVVASVNTRSPLYLAGSFMKSNSICKGALKEAKC